MTTHPNLSPDASGDAPLTRVSASADTPIYVTPFADTPLLTGCKASGLPAVDAWTELHTQLATLDEPTPCRAPGTRARWTSDAPADQQAAAHACAPCPVLAACLAYATAADEPAGVWAATTPADRRRTGSDA